MILIPWSWSYDLEVMWHCCWEDGEVVSRFKFIYELHADTSHILMSFWVEPDTMYLELADTVMMPRWWASGNVCTSCLVCRSQSFMLPLFDQDNWKFVLGVMQIAKVGIYVLQKLPSWAQLSPLLSLFGSLVLHPLYDPSNLLLIPFYFIVFSDYQYENLVYS